ncbi:biotin--[acetyl-CoA-carboxylase] ligase [Tundrisphaera sp. TA3]|uniref:biotin--[acetyl-CoA-carboxylase] ligase n=1 Tax=Tundrisphaera sp. TA3 TaxID=3435775 RepID=UPI003EB8C3F3
MNIALLDRLKTAGGFVSEADLGPDRAAIRADLDDLERFGFAIERHPYLGIAYRGPAGRLCPDQIEWELGTRLVGRRIAVWNRIGSTNDLAARAAGSRANAGFAVLAEEQTAGRGRRGRVWTAPAGASILLSVLLFPPPLLDDPAWLTALGSVAVAEVVGDGARIKWPNDVRVDRRKVAGILVERGQGTVLGIGLNVNVARETFPEEIRDATTSLQILRGGLPLDRSEVARSLLRRLDHWYHRGIEEGPASLIGPWRDASEHLGRAVEVETAEGRLAGVIADLDPRSGISLILNDGSRRVVPGRDVAAIRDAAGG